MKALIFLVFSLLTLAYFSHAASQPVQPAPMNSGELLALNSAEQAVWIKGAFDALGHLVYQSDKDRAACIWRWLDEQAQSRQEFLIEYFRAHPDQRPTTAILTLLKNDCRLEV